MVTERKNRTATEHPLIRVQGAMVLMGTQAKDVVSGGKLNEFTRLVSKELEKHPETMLQYDPGSILDAIKSGRSVLCLSNNLARLLAFGQVWTYPYQELGKDVLEFGSWLSFDKGVGNGRKVLVAARELGYQLSPKGRLVALVEHGNIPAQRVLESEGGVLISYKHSEFLTDLMGQAKFMNIYDITKRLA